MDEFPNKEQNPGIIQLEDGDDDDNEPEFITLLRTRTKDFGVGLQLETLIRTDNKQEFVSFLKTLKFDYTSYEYLVFKHRLLKLLCYRRAIGCATALLNGETVLPTVDLNEQLLTDPLADEFEEFFPTPLRIALLKFYAMAVIKSSDFGESVHKLFSLFRLQELKEPLDTIKLLASRTKQVINIGVCCVDEWNLVKLAALLMVIDNDIYSSPIPMLIGLQHGLESDLEKKQVTRSMWQTFRLVERSRDILKENRTTSMLEDEVVPPDVACTFLTEVELHDKGTHIVSADLDRALVMNTHISWLLVRAGISDTLVSKATITLSRRPSEDHKRVLLGRANLNLVEQSRGPKLFDASKLSRQAALSMSSRPGTYSSAVFAHSFHTPVKIHAHFVSFISAKILVDVLRRHPPPPMQCISIVAALTSGFGHM